MKIFRIVIGIIAVISLMATFSLPNELGPNSIRELVYTIFVIPILVLNLWAWMYPEIIEIYMFGKKN